MEIEPLLREDLWKAIQRHYEKNDYTESVRDVMFFLSELVREKSGLVNKDGTKLFEAAFLGSNPALKINDGNSETERNIQEGLGFVLKGITQMIRNPISHENMIITESESNAIILFSNELLKKIDDSNGKTIIDNYMDLIRLDDFTPTKVYADLVAAKIPPKKRYELLVSVFEERETLFKAPLQNLIENLYEQILTSERKKFQSIIDLELLCCKADDKLAGFINLFYSVVVKDVDDICRLRIEDLILKSVKNGKYECPFDPSDIFQENGPETNHDGKLAENIADNILLFQNTEDIIIEMYRKLTAGGGEENYVLTLFPKQVFQLEIPVPPRLERRIRKALEIETEDNRYVEALEDTMNSNQDNQWKRMFGEAYTFAILSRESETD